MLHDKDIVKIQVTKVQLVKKHCTRLNYLFLLSQIPGAQKKLLCRV